MKKCKFCNGTGKIARDGVAYYVKCSNCGARAFSAITEEEAIQLWNKMMTVKEENDNG